MVQSLHGQSMISPIPPTWGGVGDMWGLGHTICAPWWGKVQLTVWGSKFNFFNMWHAFTVKNISQGWGWGNGGGNTTAVMPHGGGGGGGGHWSMDNSPTPPQVGGLIIDRCITSSLVQVMHLISLKCYLKYHSDL